MFSCCNWQGRYYFKDASYLVGWCQAIHTDRIRNAGFVNAEKCQKLALWESILYKMSISKEYFYGKHVLEKLSKSWLKYFHIGNIVPNLNEHSRNWPFYNFFRSEKNLYITIINTACFHMTLYIFIVQIVKMANIVILLSNMGLWSQL